MTSNTVKDTDKAGACEDFIFRGSIISTLDRPVADDQEASSGIGREQTVWFEASWYICYDVTVVGIYM